MIDREYVWSRLASVWVGAGSGSYPEISTFRYLEQLVITRESDWNMLSVLQRTWLDQYGEPRKALHLESGIIQVGEDGGLVYSCAQDSGRTEVMKGTVRVAKNVLRIDWVTIAHAKDDRLLRMGRTWWLTESNFQYEAYLSTVRNPKYRKHLDATLHRRVLPERGTPPNPSFKPHGLAGS